MAVLSISAALMAALGDSGRERLALLVNDAPSVVVKTNPAEDISRLYADLAQLRSETRLLNLEKEALATKLAEMETQIGPTTASIPPRAEMLESANPDAPIASVEDVAAEVERFAHPEARKETQVTRTRFAIEVGAGTAIDALRARWERLLAQAPSSIDGLEPSVALDETEDGNVEMRLLAGAFDDMADAVAACADLEARALACRAVPLDGNALVMR